MNINCVICTDIFVPLAEVYITKCGHMFHYNCLIAWIERSKTCPQCRSKVTDTSIHRVYFNLANTDGITDNVGTLQSKLETIQFQMSLKEKDAKIYDEKYRKTKKQNVALRQEIANLEDKVRVHESAIHALKDQIGYFKSKSKETDQLSEELVRLRNKIKDMENVTLAINGTRQEVNEMLKNERNIESLALLAATLKKSLLDVEKKKRELDFNLRRSQNDAAMYRRECTNLECQNNELTKELQQLKSNYEQEKQYLKKKISDLDNKIAAGNVDITNTSLKRIIAESPVNFTRRPQLTSPEEDSGEEVASPSVAEKVKMIMDSDSPYLPVKSSSIPLDYTYTIGSKLQPRSSSSKNGYSIFKQPAKKLENVIKLPCNTGDVVYNGLGSSSKDDIFPSPKPVQVGTKRQKSTSSLSYSKFRKLAPTNNRKITSFDRSLSN